MEGFNCFKCNSTIRGGLKNLRNHFQTIHGLSVSRGHGEEGFTCAQQGCKRNFAYFHTLRRHILRVHSNHHIPITQRRAVGHSNDLDSHVTFENRTENIHSDTETNIIFDLRSSVVMLIGNLRANSSVTGSVLTRVIDESEALISETMHHVKEKFTIFFKNKNLMDDPQAQNILATLDIEECFENLRTLEQQISALKEKFNFIEPIEKMLGGRTDQIFDSETGTFKPHTVYETFQYVPIIEVLKLIMSHPVAREAISSEKPAENGVFASFVDGRTFKNHPFFLKHFHALRIELYADEFEIVNPLGSKKGVHKILAFYYRIQNLPVHLNSLLGNMHVLLFCSYEDKKKYGLKKILAPFMEDLGKLESDEGILVPDGENTFVLRASIAAFTGDGLSAHEVFGLIGPSANLFTKFTKLNCTSDKNWFTFREVYIQGLWSPYV